MSLTLHFLGVFLVFSGLGAVALVTDEESRARKLGSMAHGIGLLIVLATGIYLLVGFGMGTGMPGWVWGKIVIWLLLGAVVAAFRRAPDLRIPLFFLLPVLGAVAAWLAVAQPGT